ncbi:YybH family protein [Thermodesulfobacteriota bacterium]
MKLSREELKTTMIDWEKSWNDHDIDGVMELFHDNVLFEHWHGAKVRGKEALHQAWAPWFANHNGFRFITEDLFIDDTDQKVLYRWTFEWSSIEKGYEGRPEKRRGVDVISFQDGKIIQKLTYSKTTVEIEGERIRFVPA